jgi:acetyl esterase/lipase
MLRVSLLLVLTGWSLFIKAQDTLALKEYVYGYNEGVALVMNVIKPPKPNGIAVIRLISSGWISHIPNSSSVKNYKAFTDRGQTVFLISHGSQPRYKVDEIFEQVQRSVRYIRYNARSFEVDPERIGITGVSAGAHLSLLTSVSASDSGLPLQKDTFKLVRSTEIDPVDLVSSKVGAVGCFCPPSNLVEFTSPDSTIFHSRVGRTIAPKAFAVTGSNGLDTQKMELRKLSPFYFIAKDTPPTIIIHGDSDRLVPVSQSELYIGKLRKTGIPCELVVKEGSGHTWKTMNDDNEIVARWFEKYLSAKK